MIRKSGLVLLSALAFELLESLFLGYGYYIIVAAVLFFVVSSEVLIYNVSYSRDLWRLNVTRTVSGRLRKNRSCSVTLSFTNPTTRHLRFSFSESLPDVFYVEGDSSGSYTIPPGGHVEFTYRLRPMAIGLYSIGPTVVQTQDAFGLCLDVRDIRNTQEVKVAPSIADVHSQRSELMSNIVFTMGVHYSRKVGQGYDFYGIREYQETDDYRYVAWSRFGMVNGEDIYIKQMEEERQLDVVFVLDYSDAANIGARDRKVFDRMVSSVINCAYSIVRNRDGVGFLLFHGGRKVLIEPRRSREPIEELERLVSGIRPAGSFNLEQAIEEAQDMVKKDALLFLISPLAHAESLNFKQRIKHRSGKRVFVFIIDPSASVEIPGSGPERRLALGVLMKHRKDLEAIRQFLAGNGVRARVVDMNHLLLAMSSEYRYGKISVPG